MQATEWFSSPIANEVLDSGIDHDSETVIEHGRNDVVILLHPIACTIASQLMMFFCKLCHVETRGCCTRS